MAASNFKLWRSQRKSWLADGKSQRDLAELRSSKKKAHLDLEQLGDRLVPSVSTISGTVHQDLTGNGLSVDDTPMGSVEVILVKDSNNNGVLSSNDQLIGIQYTNNQGAYSFTNLIAGRYFAFDWTPSGFVETAPTPTTYRTINLGAGTTSTGNDFDNYQVPNSAAITNISYTITDPTLGTYTVSDLRGNTHQNDTVTANFTVTGSSPALVTLAAYDAPAATFDATAASQQVLVEQSSQLFSPGTHTLTVKIPNNYYQVDFVCGAAINQFGPAGGTVFYSAECRLLSADNGGTQSYAPATVSGVVYSDVNGNGVYNSGTDTGIAGVTVTLTGTNDLGQSVTQTAVTGANGSYSFAGLRSGTYTITQTTPAQSGYTDETSKETFTLGGTATPGQIAGIHATNGAVGGNYNLPEVPQAPQGTTISGVVYLDSSHTGKYVSTDSTDISGVTVTLTGTNDLGQSVTQSVLSGANGSYSFTGVLPGTYTVTYTAGSGDTTEAATDAPAGTTATAGQISNIVITSSPLTLNLPEINQGIMN